ncbi:hypothetical protein LJB89_04300 [Tyzzerella sp. OttesenSCG-928-J15]|nr:hypothetical protein [Tyzzerella sp. OttesenSCG-928-J15]
MKNLDLTLEEIFLEITAASTMVGLEAEDSAFEEEIEADGGETENLSTVSQEDGEGSENDGNN